MSNKMICDVCGKVIEEGVEHYTLRRAAITPKRYGNWDLCSHRCLDSKVGLLKED